jgi:8-oxo-dGTP pyrophosphatase MutT (NUDIX family)
MAQPRCAAGALFLDAAGRVLLVRPHYKPSWDIPGGYVEPGESPLAACRREVEEELGLARDIGRLLVVDWAPTEQDGDKLLFVFDGGRFDQRDVESVRLDNDELVEHAMVGRDELGEHLNDRLVRRVTAALDALTDGRTLYLEHGRVRIDLPG